MGRLAGRCDEQSQNSHKLHEASGVKLHNPSASNLCEAIALAQLPNSTKPMKSHGLQIAF
jgi:hypothetical protein